MTLLNDEEAPKPAHLRACVGDAITEVKVSGGSTKLPSQKTLQPTIGMGGSPALGWESLERV